jgi:phenylacetate-CoA ligase
VDPVARARGTLTIVSRWPGQRRVPFLPRERLLERRDARAREAAHHAAETVPFYRDWFARKGIDPREIATADDLARLPPVTKELVQRSGGAFRSDMIPDREGLWLRTSGTTGLALDVFHDRGSLLANIAYARRERAVDAVFCGRRPGYTQLGMSYGTAPSHAVTGFYAATSYRPLRPRRVSVSTDGRLEDAIAAVDRVRPAVVKGPGAYLEALFRTAAATGTLRHRPRLVSYYGDAMSAAGREVVESHFGVPVVTHYNAVEAFKIGYFCEERQGFHLHEDLCHLRLVDGEGREVPEGAPGEVVISNLVNRGMALLNYRLGDVARLSSEPCPCGRTTLVLAELEGRREEMLELPGSRLVRPREVWGAIKHLDGLIRYQLVQHDRARFELRLATVTRECFDEHAPAIAAAVRGVLDGCEVEVSYAERLDPEPGRKFRPVVLLGDADGPLGAEPA